MIPVKHRLNTNPYRPSRLLIAAASLLNRENLRVKQGLTIDRSALEGVEPPYIVLFNHVGDHDHYIVGMTLYPHLANYMVSRWVAHSFPTGPLSALAGAIHKDRFIPDAQAVMQAKRVLKERKGVVAIAPAASYSIDGTPNYFDFGIAKFVKIFKVPVFVVKVEGLYMFRNRFTRGKNRCKLTSGVERIFDGPELAGMDVVEIYKKLYAACDFNDYQYQESVQALIQSDQGGLADGMEYIAYKCLNCGAEFSLRGNGDLLACEKCGNTVRVNNHFFFEPTSTDTVYVKSLDRWNSIQKKLVAQEVENPDFSIVSPCALQHYTEKKRFGFSEYGRGTLTLDRTGLTYTGTDKGKAVSYHYPLADTPYIGSDARSYLSIDGHSDVFRFVLDDMRMGTKYLLALRILRLKYYPNFADEYEWLNTRPTVRLDDGLIGCPKRPLRI